MSFGITEVGAILDSKINEEKKSLNDFNWILQNFKNWNLGLKISFKYFDVVNLHLMPPVLILNYSKNFFNGKKNISLLTWVLSCVSQLFFF